MKMRCKQLIRNQTGMTLVELMVVIVVIGILANLSIPSFIKARTHADAARVLADVNVIRSAAFNYYAKNNAFPATGRWDTVPNELVNHLPKDFKFSYESAGYRWRSWAERSWSRRMNRGQPVIAVIVRSSDQELIASLKGIYSGRVIANRRRITFILE
jgi:prepilin-type N-terminal cleavage/methylation domain-containing protein